MGVEHSVRSKQYTVPLSYGGS